MKSSHIVVAYLGVIVFTSVATAAPIPALQPFMELRGRADDVEARGLPTIADDNVRILSDVEATVDAATTLESLPGATPSSRPNIQRMPSLDVTPARRTGRPRTDRLGMDPKRVAALDRYIRYNQKRREKLHSLPEDSVERKQYSARSYTSVKVWRSTHDLETKILNRASGKRRRVRKRVERQSVASRDTDDAQISTSTTSGSLAHTTSDMPSSLRIDHTSSVRKAFRAVPQETTHIEDTITAPPRTPDTTAEPEHKNTALFEELFGSASPVTSPRATSPEEQTRLFDLNETPPASPPH